MKVSIFVKSHAPDFEYLQWCLRSIARFGRGFHEVVVALPMGERLPIIPGDVTFAPELKVVSIAEHGNGYLFQQNVKMNADAHCEGDYIFHIDSDTVLKRPLCPEDLFQDGKVRWFMTPFNQTNKGELRAWLHVMTKFMQQAPTHEFMRKCTLLIPRWAYGALRDFCFAKHGVTLDAYIMNQPKGEFTEYNCMGFFLHEFHHEKFFWHDEAVLGIPPPYERQFWSHTPIAKNLAELERLVA